MTMTMTIIITMNIYISPDNQRALQGLKGRGESMSGLVNHLIDEWRMNNRNRTTLTSPEVKDDEGWVESNPPKKAEKLPCCLGSKPCKHWVWDMSTGDGYVNTLTGEVREV